MHINDMFQLGNKFMQDGNMPMAVQMWQEIIKLAPDYGPAHINMAHFLRTQNNVVAERDELVRFMDCPLTAKMLEVVPTVKSRIAEIETQLKQPQTPK